MFIEEIKDITPPEAFMGLRLLPMPFIFSGGNNEQRRYSFLGAAPFMTVSASPEEITIEADGTRRTVQKDPFNALSEIIGELQDKGHSGGGPFPFNTGAAGYFSYALKDAIEPGRFKKAHRSDGIPLLVVGFYDPLFVYDHHKNNGHIVSRVSNTKRLSLFRDTLLGTKKSNSTFGPSAVEVCGPLSSTHTKGEYMEAIARAQEYIAAGDIYQINLSQRLTLPLTGDAFSLYLILTDASPAPFSSFMDLGTFQIISNSPERLLKVSGGYAETSPIKGTRPRGETRKKDMLLIEELRSSTKERAEHVMIVDLVRNDLGRISLPGSVEVTDFETIETFQNLHHMVSNIRGRLKTGVDPVSALKALFPGGSVTGAPKIRAMEIIDELEPVPRSIYTGGIGWIDFDNEMDITMAIRTALLKDGHLHLNVGGGIVADSVPEDEYAETILKAQSFLEVMGIALNRTNY